MKAQQYGRIVNISSTAGRMVSTRAGAHYTASKAGLVGLTRAAAKELGPFGITVNAVCPGMIDTELTREHATPERLAKLAAGYPRGSGHRVRWPTSSASPRPRQPATSRARRSTSTAATS